MVRGSYSEIVLSSLKTWQRKWITQMIQKLSEAEKVDGHGGWQFGIDGNGKRFAALNWDLYGLNRDYHSNKMLAVIQIRSTEKRSKRRQWLDIKKSYFLIGRNEDKTVFAHPVDSRVIHSAIRREVDVILATQNWIFDGDYTRIIRQGDMALLPLAAKPNLNQST